MSTKPGEFIYSTSSKICIYCEPCFIINAGIIVVNKLDKVTDLTFYLGGIEKEQNIETRKLQKLINVRKSIKQYDLAGHRLGHQSRWQ